MLLFRPLMTPAEGSSLSALARRLSEVSVIRFGVVGVSNTAIGFGVFWSLHHLMPAAGAQGVAYTLGTLWSYYWNRRWTFQSQGKVAGEASRFFGLQIGFMLLSSALLGLLVDRAHLPSGACWLAVAVVITVLNFVASRYWAFKAVV
jgi:putative flippase GtrA